MEHPDIDRIMRMGYPSREYLEWERQQELEGSDVEEENEEKSTLCQQDA